MAGTVVLHADDFGMNRLVTAGILRGFRHGVLTATSLLANAPHATEALADWRQLEDDRAAGRLPSRIARRQLREPDVPFELGVHLNLTQGRPLTGEKFPGELLDGRGRFVGIGTLFRHLRKRRPRLESGLRGELCTQVEFLIDYGHRPTHLNGHQYLELLPGLREILPWLLSRYGIRAMRMATEPGLNRTTLRPRPQLANWCLAQVKQCYARSLRRDLGRSNASDPDRQPIETTDAFFGTSHAGRVDQTILERFFQSGRPFTSLEIGLHPALAGSTEPAGSDTGWADPLKTSRPLELELLTGPAIVQLLQRYGRSLGRFQSNRGKAIRRVA